MSHDRCLAEDLVQQALMQVYRSWRRRAPDVAHGEACVRRAVVNEYLRRRQLHASGEIVTDQVPERVTAVHFDGEITEGDARWQALAVLPPRQRTVLVLRYYEALPDREIASLIGARQATVRSLAGLPKLVDALNAPPRRISNYGCEPDGRQDVSYKLIFGYAEGPGVVVHVDPHCTPTIGNGNGNGRRSRRAASCR